MKDLQREILQQVASGLISAQEGAARLEALETASPAAVQAPPVTAPSVRRVRVVSQFGAAEVVGDPSVAFAVAEGPHVARQDGDTMVIEHQPFEDSDAFSFGEEGRLFNWRARRLTVRMNPDLPLLASVQAGNVRVDGVHGPITADVQAGNCSISDFRSPITVSVQAGNVSAGGRLEAGNSSVRCEMGSVKLTFDKGSSVRIKAHTTMGKLSMEAGDERTVTRLGDREVTIGSGDATLDVQCTMGNVRVAAQ